MGSSASISGSAAGPGTEEGLDEEEEREAMFYRLEMLGYRVGQGLAERYVTTSTHTPPPSPFPPLPKTLPPRKKERKKEKRRRRRPNTQRGMKKKKKKKYKKKKFK